jgi:hypothetical protein
VLTSDAGMIHSAPILAPGQSDNCVDVVAAVPSVPTFTINLRGINQVDLLQGTVDLNPGATKNRDARVIKMTQEVRGIISTCIAGKKPEDRTFTRENGKPTGDFRKMWYKMCCAVD